MKSLKLITSLALGLLMAGPALAQSDYPNRPIRIVVPFGPGGSIDFVTRIMSDKLAKELGQPVIVENREGAAGNIGVADAKSQPADGYTILAVSAGTVAINPWVFPESGLKPAEDFTGVTLISDSPGALGVQASLGVSTVKEFLDHVKAHPDELNYSGVAATSPQRLSFEVVLRKVGAQMQPIFYNSGGASLTALLSGEVAASMLNVTVFAPHKDSGRVKVIGIAAAERVPEFPDVPTLAESGYPELTLGSWTGLAVRAGTPEPVVERLFAAINKVLKAPEVVEKIRNGGAIPLTSKSPAEFSSFLKQQTEFWGEVIQTPGIIED